MQKRRSAPATRSSAPAPGRSAPAKGDDARRLRALLKGLETLYPEAECELTWRTPFELLCATILSAQCTDVRVNLVTPGLFARWPDAAALARASQADLEAVIHSTGFYRNKAKSLLGMARALVLEHGGEVPHTMEEMLALPGVARKTANVVLGNAYGLATGIAVDTHVMRLSQRLGLTTHDDPKRIEQELIAKVPQAEWISFSHRVILHGRRVCDARKPKCDACLLLPSCPTGSVPAGPGRA